MIQRSEKYVHGPLNTRPGFTLTEMMLSVLIIMVLATGAMGYQYASTRDVKISEVQAGATRIAMLLLESWKGRQGAITFDPVDVFSGTITIQTSDAGPAVPDTASGSTMTLLGSYEVVLSDVTYYVTLSYHPETDSEPMTLNATVTWRRDYSQAALQGNEQFVRFSSYLVSY